ncbi:hypothetical protein BU23DRAFT_569453 [Bimuria novae-zelandiae CBS 107.79]|uniref:Uncharacterized protein n=1 Tax=Bimuria novae-zelandiae CBS 107.79 TaxID=1447943 RepID=A0A6A5V6Q5_9PLEO|nr:hypothetical protein BU23DRAFT_569453 [Bimuria novae-zelandiae CBS 107.79]
MDREDEVTDEEYHNWLFAAAVRTNCLPLLQDCLSKNPMLLETLPDQFIPPRLFFSSPKYRPIQILRQNLLLGSHTRLMENYANPKILSYLFNAGDDVLNIKLRQGAFWGAVRANRAEILFFVYKFKKDELPWNFNAALKSSSYPGPFVGTPDPSSLQIIHFIKANVPFRSSPSVLDQTSRETTYSDFLQSAARDGRLDTIIHVLERGDLLPVLPRPLQNYPISIAVENGHTEVMELLLEHGADGKVALDSVAQHGNMGDRPYTFEQRNQLLLEHDADANGCTTLKSGEEGHGETCSKRPIICAVEKESVKMFKALVEHGADLHSKETANDSRHLAGVRPNIMTNNALRKKMWLPRLSPQPSLLTQDHFRSLFDPISMELLDLPAELLEQIFHDAIIIRGIGRGLRLRLVSRTFSDAVMNAIYTFRLFDDVYVHFRGGYSSIQTPYLIHRVMHEPSHSNPALNNIKRLAVEPNSTSSIDNPSTSAIEASVSKICSTLIKTNDYRNFGRILTSTSPVSDSEYEKDLFAAAICTSNLAVV